MRPVLLALLAVLLSATADRHCFPGDACWPTIAEWTALDASLTGSVMAVLPPRAQCFNDGPGSAACTDYDTAKGNPYLRQTYPGAMNWPNWQYDSQGRGCEDSGSASCYQGNVPVVGIVPQTETDISLALEFAHDHNLRLVVKTTGHDFSGRSTAPEAVMLWMHEFKSVTSDLAHVVCPGDAAIPTITAHGGAIWKELFLALPAGYEVVAPNGRFLAASGGVVLGGGHSFASPAYGLIADNVVEFRVALPDGTVWDVSACSHPDLFWALRGGGGNTFGVVMSTTYKLHAKVPVTGWKLSGTYTNNDATTIDAMIDLFLGAGPSITQPDVNGGIWGGYFTIINNGFNLNFVYKGSLANAQASAAVFSSIPAGVSGLTQSWASYDSFLEWYDGAIPDSTTGAGAFVTNGGRLVPASAFIQDADYANRRTQLRELVISATRLNGQLVAGGAVAAYDPTHTLTSVAPAWRTAGFHVTVTASWAANSLPMLIANRFSSVSTWTGVLRTLFPNSGAYFAQSDYYEPNWQASFWGSNYRRLQSVKSMVDPYYRFRCHHCVEPLGWIRQTGSVSCLEGCTDRGFENVNIRGTFAVTKFSFRRTIAASLGLPTCAQTAALRTPYDEHWGPTGSNPAPAAEAAMATSEKPVFCCCAEKGCPVGDAQFGECVPPTSNDIFLLTNEPFLGCEGGCPCGSQPGYWFEDGVESCFCDPGFFCEVDSDCVRYHPSSQLVCNDLYRACAMVGTEGSECGNDDDCGAGLTCQVSDHYPNTCQTEQ